MKIIRLIGVLLITTFCAFAVNSQTSRGTVTGTVTDANGAVISGATVTLIHPQTGVERSTTTNSEGVYRFDAVDSGVYSVKISAQGFGEVTKTNVEVAANQTADVGATKRLRIASDHSACSHPTGQSNFGDKPFGKSLLPKMVSWNSA